MFVFPAIDIYQGNVVRLAQGDYDRVTVYNDSPVEQAQYFADQGASWIHVVDLDGAKTGTPANIELIKEMAQQVPVRIEAGGGVRTREAAQTLLNAGVERVVLGTKLATDFDFTRELVEEFGPDKLVAGVDARDGKVATQGWIKESTLRSDVLVAQLAELGLRHLVYTDIARDGMKTGIDVSKYETIAAAAGFPVIVSGGVSTLDDFARLRTLGDSVVEGVISGRALYEKEFDVRSAIAVLEKGETYAG